MRILIQHDRDAPITEHEVTPEIVEYYVYPIGKDPEKRTRETGRLQVRIGEFSHASKLIRELFRTAIWFVESRKGGKCCLVGDDEKVHFAHPDRYAKELGIPRIT